MFSYFVASTISLLLDEHDGCRWWNRNCLPFRSNWVHPLVFRGVHVTRSIILCVCFVDCCLSFCTFVLFALRFTDYDYPFGIFRFTDYDYPFGIFKLLLVTQGCFLWLDSLTKGTCGMPLALYASFVKGKWFLNY